MNNDYNNVSYQSTWADSAVEKRIISQVYVWMTIGLAITGFIAYYASQSEGYIQYLANHTWLFWVLIIAQFGMVLALAGLISKMQASTAVGLFLGYALLNGLTLSTIFLVYPIGSIAKAFFITAGTFAVMSVYGLTTKQDLTKMGNILLMGLIGVVIASLVNMFLKSSMMDLIISLISVVIFTGLIAYDSQKIKMMAAQVNDNEAELKLSVMGALSLYMDFINLFLALLRIFGGRNDD